MFNNISTVSRPGYKKNIRVKLADGTQMVQPVKLGNFNSDFSTSARAIPV